MLEEAQEGGDYSREAKPWHRRGMRRRGIGVRRGAEGMAGAAVCGDSEHLER